MTKKPAQPNQSLIDGLACLEAVALSDGKIGVSDIATMLDMETTRASRLLGTLAYLGLTEKTIERKYTTGPGIHVLSAMGLRGSSILKASLPVIRDLMETHGLNAALGVLWRRHVCYLYHGPADQPLEESIGGHRLVPAEKSSIGRIMLASLPKQDINTLFANAPDVNISSVTSILNETRDRTYGISENQNSIAVAIGNPPVAGLACFDPGIRKKSDLVRVLNDAANRIAQSFNP